MSIKADRWIKQKCLGNKVYELYYDGELLGKHQADKFRHDRDLNYNDLLNLEIGQEIHFKSISTDCKVKAVLEEANFKPLITPFVSESVRYIEYQGVKVKCPSYGLSSYGYDIRVSNKFKVFQQNNHLLENDYISTIGNNPSIDPVNFMKDIVADYLDIPVGGFALGVSIERVCMPRNITATCMAKSTLARIGLEAAVTPIEAGWEGYVTLEFYNKAPYPIRLYAGIGIMQLLFYEGNEDCDIAYSDRSSGGKYQNQPDVPVTGSF